MLDTIFRIFVLADLASTLSDRSGANADPDSFWIRFDASTSTNAKKETRAAAGQGKHAQCVAVVDVDVVVVVVDDVVVVAVVVVVVVNDDVVTANYGFVKILNSF